MAKVLFIFLDGVGIGNREHNPMIRLFKNITGRDFILESLPHKTLEYLIKPIDPILGVKGIPQSATGQTSIMTGINAQKELGYHLTAFPNPPLIEMIKEGNLLREAIKLGFKTTCANIYSREYFEKRSKRRRNMFPVSALSVMNAEIPFRFIEDYKKGRAVFASISSSYDPIPPEKAAKDLLNISRDYDLTFFEYFLTDSYGHKKNYTLLERETEKLNSFLLNIWNRGKEWLDIVITSDHGNSEDNLTGEHTMNMVPLFYLSNDPEKLKFMESRVASIMDIKDSIITLLKDF